MHKLSLMKINKKCELCNKEFISYDCKKQRFCSRLCKDKWFSITFRGVNSWNWKEKNKCVDCGNEVSRSDAQRCISCNKKFRFGKNSPCFKGGLITKICKLCGKEFRVYFYRDKTAIYCSRSCRALVSIRKRGCVIKNHSKDTKKKFSLLHGGTGIPYEYTEYGSEFDSSLKEQVRFRDKYTCQFCGCSQIENGRQLDCHHKDYDKHNNSVNNLISLCYRCHLKTNYNRDYWKIYFKDKLIELAVAQLKKTEGV